MKFNKPVKTKLPKILNAGTYILMIIKIKYIMVKK